MEYFRESGNLIQAGFALNAGKLLTQYGSLAPRLPPHERYDATLAICVLQSLLTNCYELLKATEENQKVFFTETITDVPHRWGLTRSFIVKNTFREKLTLERVIEHLRNSLSHPTISETQFPSTGYTTLRDGSGLVSAFRLTDSPWVKNGGIFERALSENQGKVNSTLKKFATDYPQSGPLELRRQPDNGKFEIVHDGEVFLPVYTVELPLPALTALATCLANHLAQPTIEQWDGRTIHPLVGTIAS